MINHKTVLKLMKSLNFQGKQRRSKYKSYKGEVGTVAPNILNRKFEATGEYEKLTTDVTEFSVCTEKVYLSPILDLYNNEIIEEYRNVLSRKKFPFSEDLIDSVIQTILTDGLSVDRTTAIDELFPDPKDIVFYEVSLSKDGSFLVTGNIKHFPQKSFVITPAEMVELLEKL